LAVVLAAWGGPLEYWRFKSNRFDCFITVVSLVLEFVRIVPNSYVRESGVTQVVKLVRVARLLRLLTGFQQYRILAGTYFSLLPVLTRLGGVFIVIYYTFGLIGVASFGGKISISVPELNNTSYQNLNYNYAINFNDFGGAMITLFCLMVVNNWNVIMEAFAIVSGEGVQVYFIAFWICTVVITLSVVLAVVLAKLLGKVHRKKQNVDDIDPMLLTGIEGLGKNISVTRMTKSY